MLYFSVSFALLMQSVGCLEEFLPKIFLVDSTADKAEALSQWKVKKLCARMLLNHALKPFHFKFWSIFLLQSYIISYTKVTKPEFLFEIKHLDWYNNFRAKLIKIFLKCIKYGYLTHGKGANYLKKIYYVCFKVISIQNMDLLTASHLEI